MSPPTSAPGDGPLPASFLDRLLAAAPTVGSRPWWRRAGRSWLELFALAGFAVAQPVLDVFGRAPGAFLAEGASGATVVAFALVVLLVPPTALWLAVQLAGAAHARAGAVVHVVAVALLVLLAAVPALRAAGLPAGSLLAASALVAAAVATVAYVRLEVARRWVLVAALAPLLFGGLFVATSPTSALIGGQDVAAAEVEVADARSIVFVVWDEWPLSTVLDASGGIDRRLFPNLAALADDGVWFRNATGVSNATTLGVPALVTGRHPAPGASSPIASEHPESLFTLLAGRYDVEAIESYSLLCPPNLCDGDLVDGSVGEAEDRPAEPSDLDVLGTLLGQARAAWSRIVAPGDGEWTAAVDEDVVVRDPTAASSAAAAAAAFDDAAAAEAGRFPSFGLDTIDQLVASIEPDEPPTLHFAHIQLPHAPYRFLPTGERYAGLRSDEDELLFRAMGARSPERSEADVDRHRAVLQAAYVDGLIGQIVQRLRETGLYDESVIVMTSDHGAGMEPGEVVRGLGLGPGDELAPAVLADVLHVPLIVRAPGLERGLVRDDNVMAIDLVPTIAGLVGVDLPWAVDGIDLFEERRTDPEKHYTLSTLDTPDGREVEGHVGDRQRYDGARAFADALARHTGALLPDHPVDPALVPYAVGEHGDLLGRPTGDLVVPSTSVGSEDATVEIDQRDRFDDVDLDEPLPALVEGRLRGLGETAPATVALSLGGRVAGVASTFPSGDRAHVFRAVLAPALLRPGANDLEAWLVVVEEGERRLLPLGA